MNPIQQKKFAPIGHKRWAIGEGYIPVTSHGPEREMTCHESICVFNASDQEARVQIWIFYADREPGGPYRISIGPRRTKQVCFNELTDPEPIPHGTDYASLIESDTPIVVQHMRLDLRQPANALTCTMGFADTEPLM